MDDIKDKKIELPEDVKDADLTIRQLMALFPEFLNKPEFYATLYGIINKYRQDGKKFQDNGKAPSMRQMHTWMRARDEVQESVRKEADTWLYNQRIWTSDVMSNALKMLGRP